MVSRTPGRIWYRHADGRKQRGRYIPRARDSALLTWGFPQGQLQGQGTEPGPHYGKSFPVEIAPSSFVSLITYTSEAALHLPALFNYITEY